MKAIFSLSLTDFVRADAGNSEAQHDARVATLYTAYRAAFSAGQKTPLLNLKAQCELYSTPAKCRPLFDAEKTTAACTKAARVYGAYKTAIDAVGIPGKVVNTPVGVTVADAVDSMAATAAGEFVAIVTAALAPAPVDAAAQAKAKADRAAKVAADKEAIVKAGAALRQQAIDAALSEARAKDAAIAPTLADMVRIVANAVTTGMLDADALALLDHALDTQAITVEYVATTTATDVPAHA